MLANPTRAAAHDIPTFWRFCPRTRHPGACLRWPSHPRPPSRYSPSRLRNTSSVTISPALPSFTFQNTQPLVDGAFPSGIARPPTGRRRSSSAAPRPDWGEECRVLGQKVQNVVSGSTADLIRRQALRRRLRTRRLIVEFAVAARRASLFHLNSNVFATPAQAGLVQLADTEIPGVAA